MFELTLVRTQLTVLLKKKLELGYTLQLYVCLFVYESNPMCILTYQFIIMLSLHNVSRSIILAPITPINQSPPAFLKLKLIVEIVYFWQNVCSKMLLDSFKILHHTPTPPICRSYSSQPTIPDRNSMSSFFYRLCRFLLCLKSNSCCL